jgi:hypothetical protein
LKVSQLVKKLPSANYICLKALLGHLLKVVQNSDKNKMTVRNISIVFSPTLGIPAGLFTLLIGEFSTVFTNDAPEVSESPQILASDLEIVTENKNLDDDPSPFLSSFPLNTDITLKPVQVMDEGTPIISSFLLNSDFSAESSEQNSPHDMMEALAEKLKELDPEGFQLDVVGNSGEL